MLAAAALASVLVSGRRVRANDYILLVIAFGSWVAVSTFWSITPGISQQRVVTMVQLVIMVLITWEFAHSRRQVLGLMRAWVAGSAVVGSIVVITFLTGRAETRYSAPGVSHGDIAYALLIAIPLAWYLSIVTRRRGLVLLYRVFVPFACFATLLTASRAGLLSMGFALLVIPLTYQRLSAHARLALVAAIGLLVAGALALGKLASGPVARLATTQEEITTGTLDQRTEVWAIGWQLVAEHPVLGLGTGGSKQAVSGQFFVGRGLHDTWLSVWVELGVIGLILFLLLMMSALYRPLTRLPRLEKRMAWVLAVVFIISLIPRHGDYFKSTYALLTLFALMGEVLVRRDGRSAPNPPDPTTPRLTSPPPAGVTPPPRA